MIPIFAVGVWVHQWLYRYQRHVYNKHPAICCKHTQKNRLTHYMQKKYPFYNEIPHLQHPYSRASKSSIELIVYNNESSIRAGSI